MPNSTPSQPVHVILCNTKPPPVALAQRLHYVVFVFILLLFNRSMARGENNRIKIYLTPRIFQSDSQIEQELNVSIIVVIKKLFELLSSLCPPPLWFFSL